MQAFSFISSNQKLALKLANRMLPALEKTVVFLFDDTHRATVGVESIDGKTWQNLARKNETVALQKLRQESSPITWTNLHDLPFEKEKRKKVQYALEDELENNILLLRFKNPLDELYDLYFFYLPDNLTQFQLSSTPLHLGSNNKSILGKLLYSALSEIFEEALNNRKMLQQISLAFEQQKIRLNESKIQRDKIWQNYTQSIRSYAELIVSKLKDEMGIPFEFSPDALRKIMTFEGAFESLEVTIRTGAQLAFNLNMGWGASIVIHESHLIFELDTPPVEEKSTVVTRYDKTIQYLDKYEEAAQKLLLREQSINGKNVAQMCIPKVSAAAITINIRSHKSKILTLFERYPDRWTVLREHFKPIQNIVKEHRLGQTG